MHKYLLPIGTEVTINVYGYYWEKIITTAVAILTVKDIYKLNPNDYARADQQLYDIIIGHDIIIGNSSYSSTGLNYHFWIQGHRVEIKPTTLKILE